MKTNTFCWLHKTLLYIRTNKLHILFNATVRTMSVSSVHVSVLLSVVCMGVVFVGGWYLQSSLMQLNTLVMEQHYHDQEQVKQIEELNKQIIKQNDQITQQHLQLVLLNNNGKVSREIII